MSLKYQLKPAEANLLAEIMAGEPFPVIGVKDHKALVTLFARGLVELKKAHLHVLWSHIPRPSLDKS